MSMSLAEGLRSTSADAGQLKLFLVYILLRDITGHSVTRGR